MRAAQNMNKLNLCNDAGRPIREWRLVLSLSKEYEGYYGNFLAGRCGSRTHPGPFTAPRWF
jgi:hypothetical protein